MPPPPAVQMEAPTTHSDGDRAKQHAAEPIAGKRVLKVLYLFAGTSRKGSVNAALTRLCQRMHFDLIMDVIDVLRGGRKHNVLLPRTRQKILSDVTGGKYDAVLASPPCCTFSRARHAGRGGPAPLRSARYLRGFP